MAQRGRSRVALSKTGRFGFRRPLVREQQRPKVEAHVGIFSDKRFSDYVDEL